MKGLQFLPQPPARETSPNRVDTACFIGCVAFRGGPLPEATTIWLQDRGWLNRNSERPSPFHRPAATQLLDVPVLIESWDIFHKLFAWEQRPIAGELRASTYLGAAVRSFFRQGGRRCYVVRIGDPLTYRAEESERQTQLRSLLPGFPGPVQGTENDRQSWHGLAHLFGLPDVSFVSLPDLPDLLKTTSEDLSTEPINLPTPEEQFVECSEPLPAPSQDSGLGDISAPLCNNTALNLWRNAIRNTGNFLAQHRREVTLVASLPLATADSDAAADLHRFMNQQNWLADNIGTDTQSLASAFVQLSYPWLRTDTSVELPQLLEPPEGVLLGLLAKNALQRGTFRSAIKLPLQQAFDTFPPLTSSQLYATRNDLGLNESLVDKLSCFAQTPQGLRLVSDVTTSARLAYRYAGVSRIVALVVRAARHLGEEYIFESSNEDLWLRLQDRLTNLMQSLFSLGALEGKNADQAFSVRCDRTTMTQQDIDSGRVIAHIMMNPSVSIENIEVSLELATGDSVGLKIIGMEA